MSRQCSTTERHRSIGSASLIFGTLMAVGTISLADAAIPLNEREALIALYNSTNGAAWTDRTKWRNPGDTDFNDPGTECTWNGVTCNGARTAVTSLDLQGNQLSGSIPPELAILGNLEYLYLSSNQLSGSIPPELGNLESLEALALETNQLSGHRCQVRRFRRSWVCGSTTPQGSYQADRAPLQTRDPLISSPRPHVPNG